MACEDIQTAIARLEVSNDPEMANKIQAVREYAMAKIAEKPEDFDEGDVQRISEISDNSDWIIERFVRRKDTVEAAAIMLIDTLRFRHQYQVPQLKTEHFPEEFFKIGAMFPFEPDLGGNGCVYMRVRLHRKVKELEHFAKQFILFNIDRADEAVGGRGLTVVFDCSGAGISNLDMDFIWFLIDSLIKYYPIGIQHIIVYELPWILSSAWNIIKGWMPEEFRKKIVFANKSNITKFIAQENLPYYMDGKSCRDYHFVPKVCRSAMELSTDQGIFTEKEVKKIMKIFQPYLEEAEIESSKIRQAQQQQQLSQQQVSVQ